LVTAANGEILGERYLPLGSNAVKEIIADIRQKKPDVYSTPSTATATPIFSLPWKKPG